MDKNWQIPLTSREKEKYATLLNLEISFFAEMAACGSSGSTLGKEEDLAIISGVLVSGKIDLDKDNIGNINKT